MAVATQQTTERPLIPQTHCSRCGRLINGAEPRVCVLCLTDMEKIEGQYGDWQTYVSEASETGGLER